MLLVVREKCLKTTRRGYFIYIRMARMEKSDGT
jgi:hypothetical protein